MITNDRAEEAVHYLDKTARQYGEVCGLVELQYHNIKIYRALGFLESEGTVGERESRAWIRDDVKAAVEAHSNAVGEKMAIMTRRKAAELTIEVWRTQSASNRVKML